MKWLALFFGMLALTVGCQKGPPVRTVFSGSTVPVHPRNQFVAIRPGNPVPGDTLTVQIPEGISAKDITWYINGQQGQVSNELRASFGKGDTITAVVAGKDSSGREVALTSPPVTVTVALPVITSVDLEPLYPTIATTMHVSVQAADASGAPVSFSYRWYVNNTEVEDQTGDSFSCGAYRHGDVVRVVVTPSAGGLNGTAISSGYIAIRNTPPVIVSSPPATFTGETYAYQVSATDSDHDPLTYRLESAPRGMIVSKDGLITWDTKDVKPPVQTTVTVVVDDGYGGTASQKFTLNLQRGKQ